MSNCFDPFNEYEQQSSNNHKKKDMIVSVCIMLQVDTNSPEDFISASEHGEHQVHGRKDDESVEAGDPPNPCFEEVHDEEEASIDCPVSQPISVVIDFFRCCRSYTAHKRIDRSNKDRHGALQAGRKEHEDDPQQIQMHRIRQRLIQIDDEVAHLLLQRSQARSEKRLGDVVINDQRSARQGKVEPKEDKEQTP